MSRNILKSFPADPAREEALTPYLVDSKIACVRVHCVVCVTHWNESAPGSMSALSLSEEEQWKSLVNLLAHRGWAVVDYRDKKETIRGLACPSCARAIENPTPLPIRLNSSVLLPPFEPKKRNSRVSPGHSLFRDLLLVRQFGRG
jgi:hypothetical protein